MLGSSGVGKTGKEAYSFFNQKYVGFTQITALKWYH